MIKAAFFDVDGTLLSHNTKQVSQSTIAALKTLREKGIPCIVATGRHITEMEKLPLEGLTFDGYITLNGQLGLDGEKRMLFGVPITDQAKQILLEMFENRTLPMLLLEQERVYLNHMAPVVQMVQDAISTPVPPFGTYGGGEIYQACLYLPEGKHDCLPKLAEHCVVTWWNSGGVDVIARGGGKVAGIQRYLDTNGITKEEIIAFGDGENDMEMLKFAGIGVAMGNAAEEVKQAADYVTAGVDEEGIAKALEHFELI